MRGPIRKKTGFPGQEELNERTHPEKDTQSRHSERLANGPADLCSERSPLGVARAACFERLAGVFAKRAVMRGPIRKRTGFPGQEEPNEGTHPEKDTIPRTRRTQ